MDRKHDLDTDEICCEKVSNESKITPRLRAEFVGVLVTLEGIERVGRGRTTSAITVSAGIHQRPPPSSITMIYEQNTTSITTTKT